MVKEESEQPQQSEQPEEPIPNPPDESQEGNGPRPRRQRVSGLHIMSLLR